MDPTTQLRLLLLAIAVVLVVLLGTGLIAMVRRMRQGQVQRARRTKAARRRVDAAIDRADMGRSTITAPDRFGVGAPGGELALTAEPQYGDLSSAMVSPQAPFDVTEPDAWKQWEAHDLDRRRVLMLAGYLAHPLPRVRNEALDLLGGAARINPQFSGQLALLLLDDDRAVRTKAARLTWDGDRMPEVVREVRDAVGTGDPRRSARAYSELERTAKGDGARLLPRAFASVFTDDVEREPLVAELVDLCSPDRAADLDPVDDIGERLGDDDARALAIEAVTVARGSEAGEALRARVHFSGS